MEGIDVCSNRGRCFDDEYERNAAVFANPLALALGMLNGNGSCLCNDWFTGVDDDDRTDCSQGECPAGREVRFDDIGLEECQLCEGCVRVLSPSAVST